MSEKEKEPQDPEKTSDDEDSDEGRVHSVVSDIIIKLERRFALKKITNLVSPSTRIHAKLMNTTGRKSILTKKISEITFIATPSNIKIKQAEFNNPVEEFEDIGDSIPAFMDKAVTANMAEIAYRVPRKKLGAPDSIQSLPSTSEIPEGLNPLHEIAINITEAVLDFPELLKIQEEAIEKALIEQALNEATEEAASTSPEEAPKPAPKPPKKSTKKWVAKKAPTKKPEKKPKETKPEKTNKKVVTFADSNGKDNKAKSKVSANPIRRPSEKNPPTTSTENKPTKSTENKPTKSTQKKPWK